MALFQVRGNKVDTGKYTKKINKPQYIPSDFKPHIESLVNHTRTNELINEIKKSNVSDEEKKFLIAAARRHDVFNYSLIADYYVHATPEMQRLMEKSALVIIDFDDALANGYIQLSDRLSKLIEESKDAKR